MIWSDEKMDRFCFGEKKEEQMEEENLNINQQIFYNDFNAKHKEEDKSNKKNNKEEDDDDNFEGVHILPRDG